MNMNEKQLKINSLFFEIEKNESGETHSSFIVYRDIDKYLDRLDNIRDKILLAQYCNNYKKVNELIEQLDLNDYEKKKYLDLKQKNDELDKTINFMILDEKYSFLDNILDMITADVIIQDQIVSMSDARLKLFASLYSRLQGMTEYHNQLIVYILNTITYSIFTTKYNDVYHLYDSLLKEIDDLITHGYELSNKEIDTLLFILTSSSSYEVPTFDELKIFGQENSIEGRNFQKKVLNAKQSKDIALLKEIILEKAYGISFEYAKRICKRFNINGIEMDLENKDVFKMYSAIYQIVNENDPDVLIELYDEFTNEMNPDFDFRRIIVFENDLRKAFARDLKKQVFKTEGKSFEEIDGVKVYDSSLDFKMIVTAIGAYQAHFPNPDNYSNYWNSNKILSHGNCCSLIGNSNITMAKVRNVILGFSSMDDNMLLASGIRDLNSARYNDSFNINDINNQRYMCADLMLSNTRLSYNELVYERRDLGSNPIFYKKNPDYIVFIEEYIDFDEKMNKYKDKPANLEKLKQQRDLQAQRWRESIKAAKDFGIPIVKINREKVIKSEMSKIADLLEQFRITLNSSLIEKIIDKLFSNYSGFYEPEHIPLREMYLNINVIERILNTIIGIIDVVEDPEIKSNLQSSLYKVFLNEKEKYVVAAMGIKYFDKYIQELEAKLKNNCNNFEGDGYENRK